jgi:hypothetical protein
MDICRMITLTKNIDWAPTLMHCAVKSVVIAAIAASLFIGTARADAAMVSGIYAGARGTPSAGHQLHFENRISGDIFITHTGSDGSFSTDLPPGTYDLRAEHGLVVKSKIKVSTAAMDLGHVGSGKPIDMLLLPFERQGVAPTIINSEAPATAHLTSTSNAAGSSMDGASAQSSATFYAPGSPPPPPANTTPPAH